jgi:LmbE family N-acetylglucosaminyl deacetylase
MTNGEKGSHNRDLPQPELVRLRAEEQQAAAAILGAARVHMLGYPDGELEVTLAARTRIARLIRQERPEIILTHDAWQRWQLHPDHRASGLLAMDGLVAARDHLYVPDLLAEGLEPWRPSDVLLWASDSPDHHVDISSSIDTKIRSIWAHVTQMEGRDAEVEKWVRQRAADRGAEAGMQFAEAFKRLKQT